MFRKHLESHLGREITDTELKGILEAATQDIKFNRIDFKKITRLQDTLLVVEICADVNR